MAAGAQPSDGERELLRIAHRQREDAQLALQQRRGRELLHVGRAVAVVVLLVVLGGSRLDEQHVVVDVLEGGARRGPAEEGEGLDGGD